MSTTHVKYLILGAGPAGSAAAEAIRQRDREGDMLIVGQEINRPYHRGPLSGGYLTGHVAHDDLFTLPPDWFASNNVRLRTGRRAAHLDVARTTVSLDDGTDVSYDRLLIATGATPARLTVPGAELPGVHYLRTFADADRLITAIAKAKTEGRPHDRGRGRALVVGAGWLGVELASTLTELGVAVDLATALPHPWGRFAGDATAGLVSRLLESRGATVRAAARLARLEGDGRVQRATFDSGTSIPFDFVAVAMGVIPTKDLLRGTSISAERAILADDRARTSVPHVYAAGDCAALLDPLFGKHRLTDHWDSATVTGTLAGRNMAGDDARYDDVSSFATRVLDVPVTAFGEPRFVDHRLVRGRPGSPDGFTEIGIAADGRICQALCVGAVPDYAANLVRHRANIAGREEELKDPATPADRLL